MNYKITNKIQNDETLTLSVEYHFGDTIVNCDVAIFQPKTLDDISTALENRAASEQQKLDAIKTNEELLKQIPTGKVVNIQ